MAEEKVSLKAIKIALLGDSTVGKSTIVSKYLKLDYKDDSRGNFQAKARKARYAFFHEKCPN